MDAFTSNQNDSSVLRSHPWTSMQSDQSSVLYGFQKKSQINT